MEYNYSSFDAMSKAGIATIDAAADPERANAVLEGLGAVGAAPDAPLPSVTHAALPVGYLPAPEAEPTYKATVRELTGADEEELARAGTNPFRFFDMVIRRGTVEIGELPATSRVLRSLTIADRDTLLLSIRIATYGDEFTWEDWRCPHCAEASDLTFHLSEIEITSPPLHQQEYFVHLRDGRSAKLRLPNGDDQAKIYEREDYTVAEQNSLMISRCVLELTGPDGAAMPVGPELGRSLGIADRKAIVKAMAAHTFGPQLENIKIIHEACGKETAVPLALGALFR